MKHILKAGTLIAAIVVIYSCNKSKTYSNRLAGGEWHVTELSVDGTNEEELPHWNIRECDIYKESCMGEWGNGEGGHAEFIWQFRNKGKTFEISNQADHFQSHADEEAVIQCQNFSGVYEVKEHKKKMMRFESSAIIGLPGKKVVLTIEKE